MSARLGEWPLVVFLFAWFFITAWVRPLMLPDEGRYVGVAWEMLVRHDWVVPTLDGLPFFHKPPLFYWITAASIQLFGHGVWAARVAPALGACLAAWSLHALARECKGPVFARTALVVLLPQPLMFVGGQFANMDMLVAGFICATICLSAQAALRVDRGEAYRAHLLAAYVCAALGVLAKGLIGALLPFLVVLSWQLLRGRRRELLSLVSWPGLLLFFAIAVPWFALVQSRHPEFLHAFFVVQHLQRFAQGGFNNVQPFWFYPVVLALFMLPWIGWVVLSSRRAPFPNPEPAPLRLLMGLWALIVIGFFTLPNSKLIGYVLPALPPLAYLIADAVTRGRSPSGMAAAERVGWTVGGLMVGLCVTLFIAIGIVGIHTSREVALKLRDQRLPAEPVFMVHDYYYDVPYLAKLTQPVTIVADWNDPALASNDNWQREIADAGALVPDRADRVLHSDRQLTADLCRAGTSWIVGAPALAKSMAYLPAAQWTDRRNDVALWRVDASAPATAAALRCTGGNSR